MAQKGDSYTVTLKKSHIDWGTHRYTGSRGTIYGEGYLPIPRDFAVRYDILNSNGTNKRDIPGKNIFYCTSEDGSFRGYLRAQGCNNAGDIYAKQFAGDKDLKGLGSWYQYVDAEEGSRVTVTWTSHDHIEISIRNVSQSGFSHNTPSPSAHTSVKPRGQISFEAPEKKTESIVQVEKPDIGEQVLHKVFGIGRVIRVDDYICIDFSGEQKEFPFPAAFVNGFLSRL